MQSKLGEFERLHFASVFAFENVVSSVTFSASFFIIVSITSGCCGLSEIPSSVP